MSTREHIGIQPSRSQLCLAWSSGFERHGDRQWFRLATDSESTKEVLSVPQQNRGDDISAEIWRAQNSDPRVVPFILPLTQPITTYGTFFCLTHNFPLSYSVADAVQHALDWLGSESTGIGKTYSALCHELAGNRHLRRHRRWPLPEYAEARAATDSHRGHPGLTDQKPFVQHHAPENLVYVADCSRMGEKRMDVKDFCSAADTGFHQSDRLRLSRTQPGNVGSMDYGYRVVLKKGEYHGSGPQP